MIHYQALRANKRDEQKVIATALDEIKVEVRSKDWDVKAAAILKLTYVSGATILDNSAYLLKRHL